MVKIKLAVIRSTRAKDGSYKIRIAIGHKSETHYIVTPYSVPSLANFKNGTIVGTPSAHHDNIKLRKLLTEYEDRLERIPNPSDYSPTELRDVLKGMSAPGTSVTILGAIDECIRNNKDDGRQTVMLTFARNVVDGFLRNDIPIAMVTPSTIDALARYMHQQGYANASANSVMQQVKKAVNLAIRDYGVKYDVHPFAYHKMLPRVYRDTDISVEDMRRVLHFETNVRHLVIARDAILLSYYLGGINMADLLAVNFGKANGVLDYVRKKTQRTSGMRIQFAIIPEAAAIIKRYMQPNGYVRFYAQHGVTGTSAKVNKYVKVMAREAGIRDADKLTYYTARKSFVQHGFDLGIPLETLEYCIGHSNKSRMIYNYMRVMRRHADDAIRVIVDHLYGETPSESKEMANTAK